MSNFVHLHVHGIDSLLDGYNKPEAAAKRAKELGMKALALTDHNHLGGAIDWQKACKKEGVKPLLGCEMYWTWDTNILSLDKEHRDELAMAEAEKNGIQFTSKMKKSEINELIAPYAYDSRQYHMILIAMNQVGWSNLVRLQSEAAAKCTFNGRYCCDNDMLKKYSEGLFMTTACVGNAVPHLIKKDMITEAYSLLEEWHNIFGDNMRLEIQPLLLQEQIMTNWYYWQWAEELGIKAVATTDSHYTLQSDYDDHDTLLCIGLGKVKDDPDRMRYDNEYWLRSYDEMVEAFMMQTDRTEQLLGDELFDAQLYTKFYLDALDNTNDVADACEDIKLGSDTVLFPRVDVPAGMTPETYLTLRCYRALYKYKTENPDIDLTGYTRRLKSELNVINRKGYAPYMLIVEEYITWANNNGCPTGPGRGSAAGSLVLLLLGITKKIDPIKYKLLFFRFLTMDRTSPPDIDSDFDYYGRDNVIHHLEDKYGKDCVAHIGTYSELGVKSGIKDVGRVLNIAFDIVNSINKKIDEITDEDPNTTFKTIDAMKDGNERDKAAWAEFNALEEEYPELFRLARTFEGVPRNMGVHASGILITPMPVNELFPTRVAKDGTTVALYTGPQLEDLNAIKFDLLGLKTITVLDRTCKSIDPDMTVDDLYNLIDQNLDDKEVFDMICEKETDGLFQIESNLFKGMIEDILPTGINDIIVITSLGRPGPLKAGMPQAYAKRKRGEEPAVAPLPRTWDIVEDTLGTICYQEQVMLIAKRVANFNDNQADSYLRKALAKKKKDKMAQCRQWFIWGKVNEETPEGYNPECKDQIDFDPEGHYGSPILGGVNNGYTEEELIKFWNDIEGYATYLFNLSHAACYSFVTDCTGYLKKYYPAKFMAALLGMQGDQEKIDKYVKVARHMDIIVKAPDINLSQTDFAEVDGDILYGLSSIKGVGGASVQAVINNRPYEGLQDAMGKIEKKAFNKRVGMALIMAGAFEGFEPNRNKLINNFYTLRKDKDERINEDAYDEDACIAYEKDVLGSPITFVPYWDTVEPGEIIEAEMRLASIREKIDKNGNMMAFINGIMFGSEVKCLCFARLYSKNVDKFDMKYNETVKVKGHVDDKKTFIIDKVLTDIKPKAKKTAPAFLQERRAQREVEEEFEGII